MIRPLAAALALAIPSAASAQDAAQCSLELVVLGAGQDAGAPQIGNAADDGPELWPSSLAVVDRARGERFLFDATPAITDQLALLDEMAPPDHGLGIDGLFLTHAHIGHSVKRSYCFFCIPGRKKCILVYWKNFIVIYICGHMVTYFISINTDIMGVVAIHIIISIKSFSKIRHC